ncbi:MAG: flagellar biosynthetic protein FliR [Rickettsiales bacterium]
MTLVDISLATVYGVFLIFCRVGGIVMLLPGIGETFVSPRIRLLFAILLSLIFAPLHYDIIPALPSNYIPFILLIAQEVTLGLILGMVVRIIMSSLHTFGMIMSFQSGLSSGMIFDPSQGTQGSLFGTFITLLIITLIFATNMHHMFITAIFHSYTLFAVGSYFEHYEDLSHLIIRTVAEAFDVGVKMSAPFLIAGLLIFIGSGIMSRLMPQLQIFFIMLPAQILIIIFMFMASIGAMAVWFLGYVEDYYTNLF